MERVPLRLPDRRTPEIRETGPGAFVLELRRTRRRPAEELGLLLRDRGRWIAIGPEGVLASAESFDEALATLQPPC
ncbi:MULTISPECIES: hypothetical protein [Rathayibacter]|uniref:Uncharacterized protein n=2 Tax=Rathayibacter festucae TaxID=110937 RepID=A0A3Q9V0U7_9MICO|nr:MULTISPECIES: hypothetical protein [Rathayibacter]AZZ53717.1 hypothetical protein C1I64_17845 [Rathayibacter festucae DSM 15932]